MTEYTIQSAFEQLDRCGFECEGGHLVNNAAYQFLKGRMGRLEAAEAVVVHPTAELAEAEQRGYDAAKEQAAGIIDNGQEVVRSSDNSRIVIPRWHGNLAGIAFATAIRAMVRT